MGQDGAGRGGARRGRRAPAPRPSAWRRRCAAPAAAAIGTAACLHPAASPLCPGCRRGADVEEGGETSFPRGRWIDEGAQAQPPYTECGSKGVAVRPRKGDAILFYSLKVDGALRAAALAARLGAPRRRSECLRCSPAGRRARRGPAAAPPAGRSKDFYSLHAGCPVAKGVKYSATAWVGAAGAVHAAPLSPPCRSSRRALPCAIWPLHPATQHLALCAAPHTARAAPPATQIHVEPYANVGPLHPGTCRDNNPKCPEWAAAGRCDSDSAGQEVYMKGNATYRGHCRLSCKVCRPCAEGDEACLLGNLTPEERATLQRPTGGGAAAAAAK